MPSNEHPKYTLQRHKRGDFYALNSIPKLSLEGDGDAKQSVHFNSQLVHFPPFPNACGNIGHNDVQAYKTTLVGHSAFATVLINLLIAQKLNTLLMLLMYT
jgi:hypothetical protein